MAAGSAVRRLFDQPGTRTPAQQWRTPTLAPTGIASITARQADVLAGMAHGHRNEEIADRLGIALDSVKTHCKAIFRALGARNRAHAVALACSGQLTVLVRDDYARNHWKDDEL